MDYKQIIEAAGAEYLGTCGSAITFRDPQTGTRLMLYRSALRTVEDIQMALKAAREKVHDFPPLLPTKPRARGERFD